MISVLDQRQQVITRTISYLNGLPFVDIGADNQAPLQNGSVISLFSGAGGFDLGLEMAGFKTVACVENDRDCLATLRYNRPEWKLVLGRDTDKVGDIRLIDSEEILEESNLQRGEAALVVGGPPCQPFSNIGKKMGIDDPKNGDLFFHYARVVEGCLPQAFIFENVEGFRHGKHAHILNYLKARLSGLGYQIVMHVVNSADYGVPQVRKRFIMMGSRTETPPALPMPTHFESAESFDSFVRTLGIRNASFRKWRSVADAFNAMNGKIKGRSDEVLMNISEVVQARMRLINQGENFKVLPPDMRPNCWNSGKHQGHDTFGRLRSDRPAVTIRTSAYNPSKGMYIHPNENRGLSSHEMAALQSFPDNYEFRARNKSSVTLVSVGKQIGNAVPPLLGRALGLAVRSFIK
jgi:DNA (cytosine-5)-methyltransferase 1